MSSLPSSTFEARCVSVALAGLVGDALGAAFEGQGHEKINRQFPNGCYQMTSASHMGAYQYPPRLGMYTDDTNSAFAILTSMAANDGKLRPADVANRHARRWNDGLSAGVYFGYPDSAQKAMLAIGQGKSAHECATVSFPDGSFANGGAMKIYPVALGFTKADRAAFRAAVNGAIRYTHCHPEGVDAAVVQAEAVRYALQVSTPSMFDAQHFMQTMIDAAETTALKAQLTQLAKSPLVADADAYQAAAQDSGRSFLDKSKKLRTIVTNIIGPKNASFQISGVSGVVTSLAAFLHGRERVMDTIAYANSLGGDTDTMASMAGTISAALNREGEDEKLEWPKWLPKEIWTDLCAEGKDTAVTGARAVAKYDGNCTIDETTPFQQTAEDKAWFHLGRASLTQRRMQLTPAELAAEVFDFFAAGTDKAPLAQLKKMAAPVLGRRYVDSLLPELEKRLAAIDEDEITRSTWQQCFGF